MIKIKSRYIVDLINPPTGESSQIWVTAEGPDQAGEMAKAAKGENWVAVIATREDMEDMEDMSKV